MLTVICSTNRKDSRTHLFAKNCFDQLQEMAVENVNYINLEDIGAAVLHAGMYSPDGQDSALAKMQNEMMIPADKFLFIIPEYNGSYPGILKLFIDAISVREYAGTFKGKKAGMIGVSSGRAGSLRSMDHLTDVLNHVGTEVMPSKLPISQIEGLIKEGVIDQATQGAIKAQIEALLKF